MSRPGGRRFLASELWLRHRRFLKFGTVGASGVLVNLAVLSLGKEFLFAAVPSPRLSLNLSLMFAILVSTMSNFTGNRHWTWLDRRHHHLDKSLLRHFGQYALACWVGIALQILLTNLFSTFLHYLLANVAAIALAGLINYLVNDAWTFGKAPGVRPAGAVPAGARGARGCGSAALLALAAFVYLYGLDGRHIPSNGDEYVYAHITRLTAASGRLLPLQSHLDTMRNTKPPLLFWQGIAATQRGKDWNLWNLRYPSVIYTLLTALLVLLLARKVSGRTTTGVTAALAFLAFLSTYRYGRPFLTDPALIFWLGLPFFTLLLWRPASFESRLVVPLLAGLELGVGLLYKSFALVVPVCFAMAWWHAHHRGYRLKEFLARDGMKIAVSALSALLIFGLWFLLDPDPAAVWNEFVVGENVGKMDSAGASYVGTLLWGRFSIWSFALAFFANAGLLVFPVGGLCASAASRRSELSSEKILLWLWVFSFFVVFSLPSQRSSRYLMPVMPALAVLLALEWERLRRGLFAATLVCSGLACAAVAYLALRLNGQLDVPLYGWPHWLLLATVGALVLAGLFVPRATRVLGLTAALLVYLVYAAFTRPLDGPLGSYPAELTARLRGRDVWVPCNFRAREEGGFFLLPGAAVHGYSVGLKLDAGRLAERYPTFAIQVPIAADRSNVLSAAGPDCRVIGERLDLRGRHSGRELKRMLLEGQLFELLFVRELLIESPRAPRDAVGRWAADECR